jgi:regulator of protease activity HflC (stomatin/prohibitin superfamily)
VKQLLSLLYFAALTLALLIIALKSFRILKENERAAIFRLGKFLGVQPGPVVLIIPYLDQVVKVRVQQIEGSEQMSEEELRRRIATIYES